MYFIEFEDQVATVHAPMESKIETKTAQRWSSRTWINDTKLDRIRYLLKARQHGSRRPKEIKNLDHSMSLYWNRWWQLIHFY